MTPKHKMDDEDESGVLQREPSESRVTFSLWAVLVFIITLFIGFATYTQQCLSDHSTRLTKTETNFEFIKEKLNVIDQRLVQHMQENGRK